MHFGLRFTRLELLAALLLLSLTAPARVTRFEHRVAVNRQAIIDWARIDLAENETLRIDQPDSSSTTLIRGASEIHGRVIANGHLWFENPTGIRFGRDAHITAAGVTGNASNGAIVHEGTIETAAGSVALIASGTVNVSGVIDASGRGHGEWGGSVRIVGRTIHLSEHALIDVSGDSGGGVASIRSVELTDVHNGASIRADAITTGKGGDVIVAGSEHASFHGAASARGGSLSGNGGFVETSARNHLDVNRAVVDTRAQSSAGSWLLDPTNIDIANSQANATAAGMTGTDTTANSGSGTFAASGPVSDSLLLTSTLDAALVTSNVVVTTTNASGAGTGNIIVVDPIGWSSSNSLTLLADNSISLQSPIVAGAPGSSFTLAAQGNVIQAQSGQISGGCSVVKAGPGRMILSSSANDYSGGTTVGAGVLEVNGTAGSGSVMIASGATLAGSGTISGNVTAQNEARLAPATGIGTLTIGGDLGRVEQRDVNCTV